MTTTDVGVDVDVGVGVGVADGGGVVVSPDALTAVEDAGWVDGSSATSEAPHADMTNTATTIVCISLVIVAPAKSE